MKTEQLIILNFEGESLKISESIKTIHISGYIWCKGHFEVLSLQKSLPTQTEKVSK